MADLRKKSLRRSVSHTAGITCVALCLPVLLVVAGCSDDESAAPPTTIDRSARLSDLLASSGIADPSSVRFEVTSDDATLSWLEGPGGAALAMVDASESLWVSGQDACESVATSLDEAGDPSALLEAAASTPDPETAETLVNLFGALRDAIGACSSGGDAFDSALAAFAWQWAVANARLDQFGVSR